MRSDAEGLVVDVDENNVFLQLYSILFYLFVKIILTKIQKICYRPNGNVVEADLQRSKEKNVKVGDVVTYFYDENSNNGQSTNSKPKLLRIREDLNWDDVIRNFRADSSVNSQNGNFPTISKYIHIKQQQCTTFY